MAGYRPKYTRPTAGGPGKKGRLAGLWGRTFRFRRPTGPRPPAARPVVLDGRTSATGKLFSRTALLLLLLVGLAGAALWSGYRVLDSSDVFRLTRVIVQGTRMTNRAEILDLGAIEHGTSLLSFDTEAARRHIEEHPWVDKVILTRNWPSTLEIRVREYRPLAMVNIEKGGGEKLYYIDQRGKLFAAVDGSLDLDFPVITGLKTEGEPLGAVIADQGLAAEAFRFLRLAARGNPILPLQSVSEVHISPDQGLVVYLVDRPFPIFMGNSDIRKRYYLLVKLMERLYRKKKVEEIKEIRMDYGRDRILVAKIEP